MSTTRSRAATTRSVVAEVGSPRSPSPSTCRLAPYTLIKERRTRRPSTTLARATRQPHYPYPHTPSTVVARPSVSSPESVDNDETRPVWSSIPRFPPSASLVYQQLPHHDVGPGRWRIHLRSQASFPLRQREFSPSFVSFAWASSPSAFYPSQLQHTCTIITTTTDGARRERRTRAVRRRRCRGGGRRRRSHVLSLCLVSLTTLALPPNRLHTLSSLSFRRPTEQVRATSSPLFVACLPLSCSAFSVSSLDSSSTGKERRGEELGAGQS